MQKSFLDKMKNLLSRKFIIALSQIVGGILLAYGYGDNDITVITGALVSFLSALAYIITEGKIDAISVGQTAGQVQEAVNVIKENVKPE